MYKLQPILKTYYDALENGQVLGLKCAECGEVVWRPLPTCQACGGTDLSWHDLGKDAVIDEILYDDTSLQGDYTFTKANQYFVNKEAYCIGIGHFPEGRPFHTALYGVNPSNLEQLRKRLPLAAEVEFIQMDGGFKSVGFRVKA